MKELEPYKARIATTSSASYYVDDKKRLWAFGELSPALHGSIPGTREALYVRTPKLISAIPGAVQVVADSYEGAALTEDGQIWYWNTHEDRTSPMRIAKIPGAKQIQLRSFVGGLVLKQDGTVWQWSRNVYEKDSMPEQVKGLPKIVDVEPYSRSFFFISQHFDLWMLNDDLASPTVPKIVNTDSHVIGIFKNLPEVKLADGGFSYYSQYAVNAEPDRNLSGVIAAEHAALGSRDGHTLAIGADGSVLAWGNNAYGQLGNGQPYPILFDPKPIKGMTQVELVAAGYNHTLAVTKDGKLYGWGNLQWLGLENAGTPTLIERFGREKIADVSAYEHNAVILTANGDVYQMGGTLYAGTEVDPEDMIWKLDMGQAKAIAAGNLRSYAVLKDGTVWSWKNIVQKKKYAAAQLRDLRRWRRSRPEAGTETSRSD
ncbi:RCC1 domain-containing protein [Paenibacillus dendritiformis]|uniref:RCC1 domain-containing protein n=1 Tax=Paenibacillus dendritiformis TaxID=130049 RepID=UPI00387E0847